MSKKHKKKHKQKHHSEPQSHVVAPSTTAIAPPHAPVLIASDIVSTPHSLSTKQLFIALLIGIILGALGTSIALAMPSSTSLLANVMSVDETESDLLERGLILTDASTSLVVSQAVSPSPKGDASATSSLHSIRIPVIIYHSVRPYIEGESANQDLYDVTPELLDQELSYIAENGYHPILMRDVDAHWRSGTPLPEKPVILTFDDGWKNQFTYAFPLLQKHHMVGVFYVFTNPIDHKKEHWMSWENIKTLDDAGMEIGGHTRTHPILTKIANDNTALDKEILEPKHIIEEHLGHPIISFAYPFGMKNESVELAVARAGYQIARTTIGGVWNDPEHRLDFHGTLSSDKLSQFKWELSRKD